MFATYGVSAATKAAVQSLKQILAQEMRGRMIPVIGAAPGPARTKLPLDGKSEELVQRLAGMNPMERLGEPESIARLVAFLPVPAAAGSTARPSTDGGMC
ncbi:MAG: 3-oxoacyl-[acyl-carrier protein] reductase [Brevundimonas sp.]|jgi:3-oxoacyl-[acyl-carrier protein] reductase|uniref:SDR family oxidoreductase n=1 Tax=Brevundimonas sp. TaxID=1871086 RepID=UPI0039E5A155